MKTRLLILALGCALGLTHPVAAQDTEEEADSMTSQGWPIAPDTAVEPIPEDAIPAAPAETQEPAQANENTPAPVEPSEAEAARLREMEALMRSMITEAVTEAMQQSQAESPESAATEPARPTRPGVEPPPTPSVGTSEPDLQPEPVLTGEARADGETGPNAVETGGGQGLRMNFRNAPLDLVLNYLAEAAGFTIVLETPVSGTFDVWNVEPLSKEEAVELLNKVLNKKGYGVTRDGKILTVYSAKERPPVIRPVSGPEDIPPTDELVTQIIQVKYVSASQLISDLQPLLPSSSMTVANDGGNKIVIQDTRANIRRMYEIIDALDTPLANVSTIRVIPLQYADAQTLATVINNLYDEQANQSGSNPFQRFFQGRTGRGRGR